MTYQISEYRSPDLLVAYGSTGRRTMNTGKDVGEALPLGREGIRALEELLSDGGDHQHQTSPNLILYYSHVPTPPCAWLDEGLSIESMVEVLIGGVCLEGRL